MAAIDGSDPRCGPESHGSARGLTLAFLLAASVLATLDAAAAAVTPSAESEPSPAVTLYPRPAALPLPANESSAVADSGSEPSFWPKSLPARNALVIGAGVAGVAAYGAAKWWDEGFGGGFKTGNEGWFGSGTQYGGADKLGHAYASYASVRLLTPLFEAIGNDPVQARLIASLATFGTFAAIEIADGFSKAYTFSHEDMLMNVAGTLAGYALLAYPAADDLLDFRLYYRKSQYSSSWDPFGDYDGQRYLIVAKADAIPKLRDHPLTRYLEVSFGYGVSGFDPPPGVTSTPQRSFYFGLGINLSRVLADTAYDGRRGTTGFQRGADLAFELVQFPTAVYARRGID